MSVQHDLAAVVFEVRYTAGGQARSTEVDDWTEARRLARHLAISTGRRTIIIRKRIQWDIYWVSLDDGRWVKSSAGRKLTKREAAELFLAFSARRHNVACVPWPSWAEPPCAESCARQVSFSGLRFLFRLAIAAPSASFSAIGPLLLSRLFNALFLGGLTRCFALPFGDNNPFSTAL